jgi:diguanylate cyclase (GGDEF)-like protein
MLRKYLFSLIGWTLLIGGSLLWNWHELEHNTLTNAAAVARASLAKDIGFRDWASSHGGVYVQPTAHTPPNPYLKVPNRDVVTTTGMKLTLMNPAFVLREVQEDSNSSKMDLSHLTSLKLFNPNNKPDEWETKALKSFDQGNKEMMEVADIGDATYMRLMKPLPITQGCLKCHADQGYKLGDVRGGIGAYVKMRPFTDVQLKRIHQLSLTHGVIWLIGLIGLGVMFSREKSNIAERGQAEMTLTNLNKTLIESQRIAGLGSYVLHIPSGIWESSEVMDQLFGIDKIYQHTVDSWLALIHPEDREMMSNYFSSEVLGQGKPFDKEYRIIRCDNQAERWVHGLGKLEFDGQGHPLLMRGSIQDITEQKLASAAIYDLAYYDTLTHLPNRRLTFDNLKNALSVSATKQIYGATLLLDLDNFKAVNDMLGHEYGDSLLIEASTRIKSCVSDRDTVGRMGGDAFMVLLEAVDEDVEQATRKVAGIAEVIRLALTSPYRLKHKEYACSASIGVSLYRGEEVSASDLLKHTDMAMYKAKESGRDAVRFFDTEMQFAVETHAALEADLRRAVPEQQLQLHYQIQVDNEQQPIGAEALVRWIHPTRGMVSPAQFIPLAEESSLILEVGDWVMETACGQLALWSKSEHTKHLTLAVNVSARQFKQPDFIVKVKNLIHNHELDATRLKIELTESVVLSDVAEVISKMHELKALRIRLSMDDFGTGYSSLSYLKQLPLDQIKIDQSFVRDMTSDQNDAVMVQTIIDLGKNFHLHVIAEGVETKAQASLLKHYGCMAYQGYLFSKPVPIEQFEELLKHGFV